MLVLTYRQDGEKETTMLTSTQFIGIIIYGLIMFVLGLDISTKGGDHYD